MNNWAKTIAAKYVNVGTPLALMGALWLYLWIFPWFPAYVTDPRWGHNYAESLAFLAVGLAYFNRRLVSDLLGLLASLLIIPAAMELLPHPVTAIAGGVLVLLIILDMIVERKREKDLLQPSNRRLSFWLKGHLLRFAYIMLAHVPLTYFFVRLPADTYEKDLVTIVYDGLLIPLVLIALMEGPVHKLGRVPVPMLGFFWGMATIIISLITLAGQPEIWPVLGVTLVVTGVAIAALVMDRRAAAAPASGDA
ncbi:MAG: hypothetical protein KKA73_17855 [Chloroflexi bacterium]|nr:hypothetical protein [Chloroflexota bacterium]MBU1749552.1 hypothetical protein [Chloroflexota bacterium]